MEALSEKGINIKENWKNALGNAVLKGKNYDTGSSMRLLKTQIWRKTYLLLYFIMDKT